MEYARKLPLDVTQDDLDATIAHVRDHLASIADADDDPTTRAEDVTVRTEHREGALWVIGELDAEPDAPYLKPDFDPFDGVDPALLEQIRDDEVQP